MGARSALWSAEAWRLLQNSKTVTYFQRSTRQNRPKCGVLQQSPCFHFPRRMRSEIVADYDPISCRLQAVSFRETARAPNHDSVRVAASRPYVVSLNHPHKAEARRPLQIWVFVPAKPRCFESCFVQTCTSGPVRAPLGLVREEVETFALHVSRGPL